MGLNIYVILFVGLFCHSIQAQSQCTDQEKQTVKNCLQQAMQGPNANAFQMVGLDQQAQPCLNSAGCNGANSVTGFGSVLSQFGFGGPQPQQQQQQPSNGNDEQCYSAVTKQVRGKMGDCIKQKIPHFDQNDAHIGSGRQHGQSGGGSNVDQELAQKCNNDKIKIRKVKACMLNTPAGQQQYQATVQRGCQCAQQVSQNCRHELEQHRQAACQCAHDIENQGMYQQFENQNQPTCAGQAVEPDGMMAVFQKMDCNSDPCQGQGK